MINYCIQKKITLKHIYPLGFVKCAESHLLKHCEEVSSVFGVFYGK